MLLIPFGGNVEKERKLFYASPIQGLTTIYPQKMETLPYLGEIVLASRYAPYAACFGRPWKWPAAKVKVNKRGEEFVIKFHILDSFNVKLDRPSSLYVIEGKFREFNDKFTLKQISRSTCQVFMEQRFSTFLEMLETFNVQIVYK